MSRTPGQIGVIRYLLIFELFEKLLTAKCAILTFIQHTSDYSGICLTSQAQDRSLCATLTMPMHCIPQMRFRGHI